MQQSLSMDRDVVPWYHESKLQEWYIEQQFTITEIAAKVGHSVSLVQKHLIDAGIPRRNSSGAWSTHATFRTVLDTGMEEASGTHFTVRIHRLVMVAEHGFDALRNREIHHRNRIPFDNRPKNLELISAVDHTVLHHREDNMADDQTKLSEFKERSDGDT